MSAVNMYTIVSPSSVTHLHQKVVRRCVDVDERTTFYATSDLEVVEFEAYLNGEPISTDYLFSFLEKNNLQYKVDFKSGKTIIVRCLDGDVATCKEMLVRNFLWFEEYYKVYTEAPYLETTVEELGSVLRERRSILESTRVLALLRPKNKLFFLEFSNRNITPEILDGYMSKLKEKDHLVLNLLVVEQDPGDIECLPLTKYGYLLTFPVFLTNVFLLEKLIPEYPSFLAYCTIKSTKSLLFLRKYIYKTSYSDLYRSPRPSDPECERVVEAFKKCVAIVDKEGLKILASMLGYHHHYFENEKCRQILPYGIINTKKGWLIDNKEEIEDLMEQAIPDDLVEDDFSE